jgi:hypothetical protein
VAIVVAIFDLKHRVCADGLIVEKELGSEIGGKVFFLLAGTSVIARRKRLMRLAIGFLGGRFTGYGQGRGRVGRTPSAGLG